MTDDERPMTIVRRPSSIVRCPPLSFPIKNALGGVLHSPQRCSVLHYSANVALMKPQD